MGKRVTIQQIAELAGVSRGTVDRVLNHRSYVSEAVRARVEAAVAETGYISPREAYRREQDGAVRPLTLGILLPNWTGQFQEEVQEGIRQAEQELAPQHVRILQRRCRTELPQESVELLDEMVREGAEGLSICALNDPSICRRVEELADAGIPCVTFNSDLPKSRRLCFVGQDLYRAGRMAGELMSRCVRPGGLVLATVGNRRFDGHCQRLNGFLARMAERGFPAEQILTAETFNDYQTTYRVVAETLERHPDRAGIYLANLHVSGCVEAVRAAGRQGQLRVICHDINESVRRLLLEGSVDFTIPQDFRQQGYLPPFLLRDALRRGQLPPASRQDGQMSILCAENV